MLVMFSRKNQEDIDDSNIIRRCRLFWVPKSHDPFQFLSFTDSQSGQGHDILSLYCSPEFLRINFCFIGISKPRKGNKHCPLHWELGSCYSTQRTPLYHHIKRKKNYIQKVFRVKIILKVFSIKYRNTKTSSLKGNTKSKGCAGTRPGAENVLLLPPVFLKMDGLKTPPDFTALISLPWLSSALIFLCRVL